MSENCILSKNVKNVLFFVFIKTTFFGQDCFKRFVFLHYSARFFKYFLLLNNVEIWIFYAEIWIFFFNRHFLIIMGFNLYNPEALNIGQVCSHHIPLDRFFGNSLAKLAGKARYASPPESRPKSFFSGRHLQLVGVYSRAAEQSTTAKSGHSSQTSFVCRV